jgi:hypothetical protein
MAKRFFVEFDAVTQVLRRFPFVGHLAGFQDRRARAIRIKRLGRFKNHVVLYRVGPGYVEIVR